MIGIVVVSHNAIGKEMVAVTKKIVPECKHIVSVEIESDLSAEANRNLIQEAIAKVNRGDGIILFSDMFGGTPSNLCISFMKKAEIEIISGFNLPMLIKLASYYEEINLENLAKFIKEYGKKNIVISSEVLNGKVDY